MVEMPGSVPLAGPPGRPGPIGAEPRHRRRSGRGHRRLGAGPGRRGVARVPVRLASDPAATGGRAPHRRPAEPRRLPRRGRRRRRVTTPRCSTPPTPAVAPRFVRPGDERARGRRRGAAGPRARSGAVGRGRADRRAAASTAMRPRRVQQRPSPRHPGVSPRRHARRTAVPRVLGSDRLLVGTRVDARAARRDRRRHRRRRPAPSWADRDGTATGARVESSAPSPMTDGEVTGGIVCVSDVTAGTGRRDGRAPAGHASTRSPGATTGPRPSAALEAMLAGAGDGSSPAAILRRPRTTSRSSTTSHGHDAGDEFLGVVARRLHGAVREDDVVGRIGGDEFLVVCPGIATSAEAVRTAIRVAEALGHEIQLKDIRVGSRRQHRRGVVERVRGRRRHAAWRTPTSPCASRSGVARDAPCCSPRPCRRRPLRPTEVGKLAALRPTYQASPRTRQPHVPASPT